MRVVRVGAGASSFARGVSASSAPGVVVKAGGVDLLDLMKEGLAAPRARGQPARHRRPELGRRAGSTSTDGEPAARVGAAGDAGSRPLGTQPRRAPKSSRRWPTARRRTPPRRRSATWRRSAATCSSGRAAGTSAPQTSPAAKRAATICYAQAGENQYPRDLRQRAVRHRAPVDAWPPRWSRYGATRDAAGQAQGERDAAARAVLRAARKGPARARTCSRPTRSSRHVRRARDHGGDARGLHKEVEKESFDWPIADVAVVLDMNGQPLPARLDRPRRGGAGAAGGPTARRRF